MSNDKWWRSVGADKISNKLNGLHKQCINLKEIFYGEIEIFTVMVLAHTHILLSLHKKMC